MKHSMKSLMVAAAVSGLMSGATALQAATVSSTSPVVQVGSASFGNSSLASHVAKHSCNGKNDAHDLNPAVFSFLKIYMLSDQNKYQKCFVDN